MAFSGVKAAPSHGVMSRSMTMQTFPSRSFTGRGIAALCLAGAVFSPSAAFARDGNAGEVARKLADPQAQAAASVALATLAETFLNMDIAPYARAVRAMGGGEAVRDLPADARLRDLAGPDAERMPREIARGVPKAMGSAAEMAGAMEDMLPELERTARRLKDAIPRY
jgi:hypothetical protein